MFSDRRRFRHLSDATPNDQRACLEAAVLTLACSRSSLESRGLRRITDRIDWKIELPTEIPRVEREVGEALAESDRMFSFIERIRERISTRETCEIILDICTPLRDRKKGRGTFESTFLTRLDQELSPSH